MEDLTFIEILKSLKWEIGIPSASLILLELIKRIHPYYKTWKDNDTKHKEIKSNERIEKMKLNVNNGKGKPAK